MQLQSVTANNAPAAATATIGELLSLLKPRVMMLVVFTGLIGMVIAPNPSQLHPFLQFLIVLSIALGSGAGGMINMWYDRDIDTIMKRTLKRPIPSGKVAADDVLIVGIMLSVASVMLLGLVANWVAAAWLGFAIFFYSVIYTMWLKRRTPQNIVIGGAAGAFPPVIGWVAMTGSADMQAWVLFAIIFFWTPPHFWALALNCNDDYTRARIPMLPVTHGKPRTARDIFIYSLILAAMCALPVLLGMAGWFYGVVAFALNTVSIVLSYRVYRDCNCAMSAKRLFFFTILYLFAIFATIGADTYFNAF